MADDVFTWRAKGCIDPGPAWAALPTGEGSGERSPKSSTTSLSPCQNWTYGLAPLALPVVLLALSLSAPKVPPPERLVPRVDVGSGDSSVFTVIDGGGLAFAARLEAWRRDGLACDTPEDLLRIPGVGALLLDRWHPFLAPSDRRRAPRRTTE